MKTLIFYKPEYADLAIKLRDNYRAHDHGEADIVSEEEHDDIEKRCCKIIASVMI